MTTRKPAVAGMFYPASKRKLKRTIQQFLDKVPDFSSEGKLKAIIVPHAGYMYSGQVAAYAFNQLRTWNETRKSDQPARIILLGPAHTVSLDGVVTDENSYWETPFGMVQTFSNGFTKKAMPHFNEHCLEVELPFLQEVLDDFQILPLVIGKADAKAVAKQIIPLLDDDTILLVSTDLSHYYEYEVANSLDKPTIEAIANLNIGEFAFNGVACGKYPVLVAMIIAEEMGWKCRLLKYCNSGDITGDLDSVVGYAAFEIFHPN